MYANCKADSRFLAIILVFTPLGSTFVKASESVSTTPVTGDKIYCTATLEDNFADDCVMVVLSNAASLSKTDYSTSDFSEITVKVQQT